MTAKLYKIYPIYEGITTKRIGSKIRPVLQVNRRGEDYLVIRRKLKIILDSQPKL